MLSAFKGRGLFVFSDPGGAKPILSLVLAIRQQLDDYVIISDREYAFFKDFGLPVQMIETAPESYVESFEPDFVFTGTSYTSKIELNFIKAAKSKNVSTYAYIDHWTSIRKRFDNNGLEIFSDFVCVIDERAKEIAIEEGIETNKILILGNPYHKYLNNWQPNIGKSLFFESLGLDCNNKKIALYAPDPLSNVDGINVFGFDEIIATKALSKIADKLSDSYIFILKPHPNQNLVKLRESLGKSIIIVDKNADANTLIYFADCVIGFFSSFLIEATVMQKKVFRFAIKDMKKDPFQDMSIGRVVNKTELLKSLIIAK